MGTLVHRPCGWCDGSGEVEVGTASRTKVKCGICGGLGYSVMDSGSTVCPDCEGSGEAIESRGLLAVILGSEQLCRRCKGAGWAMPAVL